MNRRQLLRSVGAGTAAASMAGCSAVSGFLNCGPGETKLGDVKSNPENYEDELKVKGDVATVPSDEPHIVVNDSTAKARVEPVLGEFDKSIVSSGDCAHVTGFVLPDETKNGDVVVIGATSVQVETYEAE